MTKQGQLLPGFYFKPEVMIFGQTGTGQFSCHAELNNF